MSYKIHPKFFRAYYYQKKKQVVKSDFYVAFSNFKINEIYTLNTCMHLFKFFKSVYNKQNLKKKSFYILNSFFFNNGSNFIIFTSFLFCIKGPELIKIRKRKPKSQRSGYEKTKLIKKISKGIFSSKFIFNALKSLLYDKNIWFKRKFYKIGPLMDFSFEKKRCLTCLNAKLLSADTIKKQHNIFYSMKRFSNDNFFQEAFCILNAITLNSEDNIRALIDYICHYLKKMRDHKNFYKFLRRVFARYNNLTGAKKSNYTLQIKGKFAKTKRTKKRLTKILEAYSLSKLENDCFYVQDSVRTRCGRFGVRIWSKPVNHKK